MFTESFEKEAGILRTIGRMAGTAVRGGQNAVKSVSSGFKSAGNQLSSGYKSGLAGPQKSLLQRSRELSQRTIGKSLSNAAKSKPLVG